jgi:cytochrome b subunit of formate dehydrogenase
MKRFGKMNKGLLRLLIVLTIFSLIATIVTGIVLAVEYQN